MRHLVMHYKYGGKTLYYFNTFDGAGEVDVDKLQAKSQIVEAPTTIQEDDDCEACKI
jgi:hypothetical protein